MSRSDSAQIEDLPSWLTTVVARICLDMLRARKARREEPLGPNVPDPIVSPIEGGDPEHEALVADSVGLAMLGVLETLSPEERVAFVLHDMFAVPFERVAELLGRSPVAARKAASRARKRVEAEPTAPDVDLERQREVVEAFFEASREGDFDALVAVLHPEVSPPLRRRHGSPLRQPRDPRRRRGRWPCADLRPPRAVRPARFSSTASPA